MLVDRARTDGLQLTGEGGLLQMLTKWVLESALEGESTDHLGYEKHDPAGKNNGNSRNGTWAKTVLTDVGPVEVKVPRDTAGSFEPQLVKKRQRRLTGVDEMVLSLSAKGLTHGEISAHLGLCCQSVGSASFAGAAADRRAVYPACACGRTGNHRRRHDTSRHRSRPRPTPPRITDASTPEQHRQTVSGRQRGIVPSVVIADLVRLRGGGVAGVDPARACHRSPGPGGLRC
ncbi:transposase [Streptomyces hirsutus]